MGDIINIFICYNNKNLFLVNKITADLLAHKDLLIFFSYKTIKLGEEWLRWIDDSIAQSKVALVFLGDNGVGYYQQKEILRLLDKDRDERGFLIIPIMLPTLKEDIKSNLSTIFIDLQYLVYDEDNHQTCISLLLSRIRNFKDSKKFNTTNPYKGLKAFDKEDALYFFGRKPEINRFFNAKCNFSHGIIPGENNFCAIVGNSGAGKSSFVNAGILSKLSTGKFENSHKWIQICFNPGNNAIEELCEAMYYGLGKNVDTRKLEQEILNNEDALVRMIRLTTKETVVIFIDQFEELLINHPDNSKTKVGIKTIKNEEIKEKFLSNLVRLTKQKNVVVVLSLRDDFVSQFTFHKDFNLLLEERTFYLGTLSINKNNKQDESTLRKIIKNPAKVNGVELKDNLLNKIIDDCKDLVNALPILQLLMNNLWNRFMLDRAADPVLTIENYADITKSKGLEGYINVHANTVYKNLVDRDKNNAKYIKKIFLNHLITLNNINTDGDLRRIAIKTEVVNGDKKKEQLIQLLSADSARLIHLKKDSNGNTTIEVIHEVLIREWELLNNWIEENRESLKKKAIYESLIDDDQNYILTGKELRKANKWHKENKHFQSPIIKMLLSNSNVSRNAKYKLWSIIFITIIFLLTIMIPIIIEYLKNSDVKNSINFPVDSKNIKIRSPLDYEFLYNKLYIYDKLQNLSLVGLPFDSLKRLIPYQNYLGFQLNNMKQLDNLVINGCQFKNLEILKDLKQIKRLDIYMNNILKIPELDLDWLYELEELSISNNHSLPKIEGLEKLNSLTKLNIHHNGKLEKMQDLGKLECLTELSISDNSELPRIKFLSQLSHFEKMVINSNFSLKRIDGLENIEGLKYLEVKENNNIEDIDDLNLLRDLEVLILEKNNYSLEIQGLKELVNLNFVMLSGNNLIKNVNGLEKLTNLQELKIAKSDSLEILHFKEGYNNLTSLTIEGNKHLNKIIGLENLKNLRTLTIKNNKVLNKIQGLEKLSGLQKLFIKGNSKLNNIEWLSGLSNLLKLEISQNESLTEIIGLKALSQLIVLEISNNKTLTRINDLNGLEKLQQLIISHNYNLLEIKHMHKLNKLLQLRVWGNSALTKLDRLSGLTNLYILEILDNQSLKRINFYNKFHNLGKLIISKNSSLTKITGLNNLVNLENLEIRQNNLLEELNLEGLGKLSDLIIFSNDKLAKIFRLNALFNLKNLTIRNNENLKEIQNLKSLSKLKSLNIIYNSSLKEIVGLVDLKNLNRLSISENKSLKRILEFNAKYDQEEIQKINNALNHIDTISINNHILFN